MHYCEVLAYCLMPNHFHLIVFVKLENQVDSIKKIKSLNYGITILLRSYTKAIQQQENYIAPLFQEKTKAKEIKVVSNNSMNLLSICVHYIHHNPKKAGLVNDLATWTYSPYPNYMGLISSTFCNKDLFYQLASIDKDNFIIENKHMIEEKFSSDL